MTKTITQKIVFKNTSTKILYEMYMDSKKHTIATGAPAKLSEKIGGNYSAHGGYITGKNLQLEKNKTIVQTWRAMGWDTDDVDSIFIINLSQKGKDAILEMVHALVPEKHADSIKKGWNAHYWRPWKQYLLGKPIAASPAM